MREKKDITLRVGNVTTLLELRRPLPAQGELPRAYSPAKLENLFPLRCLGDL